MEFIRSITPERLASFHKNIGALIRNTFPLQAHQIVSGYWPLEGEFDVRPFMEELIQSGFKLCLPVALEAQGALSFRRWQPGMELEKGLFGIMIPLEASEICQPDVLLTPLLAWDANGHRLGYGQGHYDRTLAGLRRHKKIMAIGVAYECQYVEALPAESTDQPLDGVVTEQRALKVEHETSLLR